MNKCTALIVAAGRGSRFGGDLPKQYCLLSGRTIIGLTLKALADHPGVSELRVVIHPDDLDIYHRAVAEFSGSSGAVLLDPVYGGASRQESVYLGLESMTEKAPNLVLIHDAARPFIRHPVIDRVMAALSDHAAVIPTLPVTDTLKRRHGNGITGTVDRSRLVRAQTPQGFRFCDILAAHRHARENAHGGEMTDDAAVAEFAGLDVITVDGGEENVKITSQQDLRQAELANMNIRRRETRTGTGFDVHRFESGNSVTLCGVLIPHTASLAGHSDADVGLHALTDALLGAIGEGDIGHYFPPTDPRWTDAASAIFVEKAFELITDLGGRIVNIDITLICENPKIAPYRAAMKEFIAITLDMDPTRVSVKATTTEGLGFTGRNEGIAAQAIASIELTGG